MYSKILKGVRILIHDCARLKKNEKALVLSDPTTCRLGRFIQHASLDFASGVEHKIIPGHTAYGEEPPAEIAGLMKNVDVVFCLTRYSIAHTAARKRASEKGCRFLSLPDYSQEVLSSPALKADFKSLKSRCNKLAAILSKGNHIKVESELGTELNLCINGRTANNASGICDYKGCLASPPDVEVNIAPKEEESEGVIIIDGSIPIPEIGILKNNVTVVVKDGRVQDIRGGREAGILRQTFKKNRDGKAYVLGELGMGLNPLAKLCGRMLEDEGAMGTVHFGFGSNSTIGGKNNAPFHLDVVMKETTINVDGKIIFMRGKLCL